MDKIGLQRLKTKIVEIIKAIAQQPQSNNQINLNKTEQSKQLTIQQRFNQFEEAEIKEKAKTRKNIHIDASLPQFKT